MILYIYNGYRYPLWLTKSLFRFVAGDRIANAVDWHRSSRNKLFIKKYCSKVRKVIFFYPDGEPFQLVEEGAFPQSDSKDSMHIFNL
uniref:PlxyGVORF60 protein n=1 Tax=Plutella xylostella granulovirus TaxID=98383 RepID=A0A1B2CSG8_9BBAC|nr:PlxyGVORF60 protein [Plutella xylostella granulovirus]